MSKPTAKDLAALITGLTKTRSQFAASGTLPDIDPRITVEGLGQIKWPLKPKAVTSLKTTAQIAPFGRGVETLIDTSVRNTFEIDAGRFAVSDEWTAAVAAAVAEAADKLGLNAGQLEAHPYKLLIYDKGGFFLPHRDSEKLDRMVATLVVVLPTKFNGGGLVVRHQGRSQSFDFSAAKFRDRAEYVAFYADCEHEVKKVSSGQRVCLTYNLVLKPSEPKKVLPATTNPLTAAIHDRVTEDPDEPLVFTLEHQYTPLGRSQDLLKGDDRELVQLVADAAAGCGCVVHFAQIEMHDTYSAYYGDDEYYDDGYASRRRSGRGPYEIQELIQREFGGVEWTDLSGAKPAWGRIPLDADGIVCKVALEQWAPTREEYEGYTGNAGNTLDRWYHRTAAVVWPRARHFSILADAGARNALPLFQEMTKSLAKTPPAERPALLTDCTALAEGILRNWPVRWGRGYGDDASEGSVTKTFPAALLRLNDAGLNIRFLAKMALHDELTPLDKFLPAASDAHGWKHYLPSLTAFFKPRKEERYASRDELSARDAAWLLAVCEHESPHPERDEVVRKVCAAATDWYCEQTRTARVSYHGDSSKARHQVLARLVQALLAVGGESECSRVISEARANPEVYTLEAVQVPALAAVVPWCATRFKKLPAVVRDWLAAARKELTAATKTRPTPPADWVRPNVYPCPCKHCLGVKGFLADATAGSYELKAAEEYRRHVLGKIEMHKLDVTTTLNQKTTPRTLILKKDTKDYQRRLKQYDVNCQLLDTLNKLVS